MGVKLVDYWGNGYIDVMSDSVVIAEVAPNNGGYLLSFAVYAQLKDKAAIKKWVEENCAHMETLIKAAN